MKTKLNKTVIKIDENVKYLTDIKELTPLPTDIILDKTLPGLGATHSEIIAHRNSILIVPNVTTIICKTEMNKETFGVHEGITMDMLKAYCKSGVQYKKIITTPEGFINKVKPVLADVMYNDYFLLTDEAHKIIVDVPYRKKIVEPMDEEFFKFKKKAMVSATPIIPSDPRFKSKRFRVVTIKPLFTYKKDITVIKTDNTLAALKDFINRNHHTNYCIFFNSIQGIKSIIDNMGLQDYKIHCSKESVRLHKSETLTNVFHKFDGCAKFNFFTSSFYTGLDMFTSEDNKPHVIMISDVQFADFTAIDPSTDAIQLSGRFRKQTKDWNENTIKSLTHIVDTWAKLPCLTEEEVKKRLETSKELYEYLDTFKISANDPYIQQVIEKQLQRINPYSKLLNKDGSFNTYKLDGWEHEEKVKCYYTKIDKLLTSYQGCKYFNVTDKLKLYWNKDVHRLKTHGSKYSPENYRMVTDSLWDLEGWAGHSFYDMSVEALRKDFPEIVYAYFYLGMELLLIYQFDHDYIMEAVAIIEQHESINKFAVIDTVHRKFWTGKAYDCNELQHIFDNHGVTQRAKASLIKRYFEVKEGGKSKSRNYRIIRPIHLSAYDRV
jgi:hypothetical protein